MRNVLFAASAVAALAVPAAASAQYYYQRPRLCAPHRLCGATRDSRSRPPSVGAADGAEPGLSGAEQTYVAPGTVYDDRGGLRDGQRYYRDCWWDWGRRRCELKPWW